MTAEPRLLASGSAEEGLLDEVHDAFARLWQDHQEVGELDRMLLETAVAEVAANVIAYTADGVTVAIEAVVHPDRIEVRFTDDGTAAPDDLVEEASMPAWEAESGRGLASALAALDDLSYRREGEVNHWDLVRNTGP